MVGQNYALSVYEEYKTCSKLGSILMEFGLNVQKTPE